MAQIKKNTDEKIPDGAVKNVADTVEETQKTDAVEETQKTDLKKEETQETGKLKEGKKKGETVVKTAKATKSKAMTTRVVFNKKHRFNNPKTGSVEGYSIRDKVELEKHIALKLANRGIVTII